jgi:hypothetical protein
MRIFVRCAAATIVLVSFSLAVFLLINRSARSLNPAESVEAEENAALVIAALNSPNDPRAIERIQALKGRPVVFSGGTEPHGSGVNLLTPDKITVVIDFSPSVEPDPKAILWTATVTGILKDINASRRRVYISAKPEDYILEEAW